MPVFRNKEEYKQWIESEKWYQTIHLPSGMKTPGKVPTHLREALFEAIDFKGKSVLDVGCNSGQYAFMAKDRGAAEVVGIDVSSKRISQARVLAENEGYDVTFEERGIFDMDTSRRFDIVLCIAVLTEIPDTFGTIEQLKRLIGKRALVELNLAKPILYASYSKEWLRGYPQLSRRTAVAEVRKITSGEWVVNPSFDVLCSVFGDEFELTRTKGGVRYDVVEIVRKKQ